MQKMVRVGLRSITSLANIQCSYVVITLSTLPHTSSFIVLAIYVRHVAVTLPRIINAAVCDIQRYDRVVSNNSRTDL